MKTMTNCGNLPHVLLDLNVLMDLMTNLTNLFWEFGPPGCADRTTVLVILHNTSFRDTMLPAATWHMQPDDDTTGNDLKKWVRWKIWEKHWVWIDLTHMWLDLVSFESPAHYPHEYTFVRKINFNEQILEVLHQYYDTPVVQERRTNTTGSSSSSSSGAARQQKRRRRLVEQPN